MRVRLSREAPDPEWDSFVESAPGGHHVQSSLWAGVKATLGWHGERVVLREGGIVVAGAQLLVRRFHRGVKLAFVPRGPVTRDGSHDLAIAALDAIEFAARRERLLYLKVQPPAVHTDLVPDLAIRGFVPSELEAAPTATVRVDLTRDLQVIEQVMRKNARRNIRRSRGMGVRVRVGGEPDLQQFHLLLRETRVRQGFTPYPEKYYGTMWRIFSAKDRGALLLAEYDGEVAAASLLVGFGDTTACKMSVISVRSDGVRAAELLHLSGMAWARDRGYQYYDLDGIDPVLARRWAEGDRRSGGGVGHFKLGLGGEVALAPAAWDSSFHPLLAPLARRAAPRLQAQAPLAQRVLGRAR